MSEAVERQLAPDGIRPGTLLIHWNRKEPTAHLARFRRYGAETRRSVRFLGATIDGRNVHTEPALGCDSGVREDEIVIVRGEDDLAVAEAFLIQLDRKFSTFSKIASGDWDRLTLEGEVSVEVQVSRVGSTEKYRWTVTVDGKLVAETQADLLNDQAMERLYDEIDSKRRAARCG